MKLWRTGLTLGLTVCSAAALAMPSFYGVFAKAYKAPTASALSKVACATCHTTPHGGPLNPYGQDVKTAMAGAKALTPDILKKVESLDSDKDGVKNIDEIKKGTLPGDPKSK